jgi:hypothetical protein
MIEGEERPVEARIFCHPRKGKVTGMWQEHPYQWAPAANYCLGQTTVMRTVMVDEPPSRSLPQGADPPPPLSSRLQAEII